MKKLALVAVLPLFGCLAADAQYMCEKEGAVLKYNGTTTIEGKTYDTGYSCKVLSVVKDGDAVVSSTVEETHKVPGNDFAEIKNNISYSYNPATGLTVEHLMTADEFRKLITNIVSEAMRQMGQTFNESMLVEIQKAITVKGDLSLDLPAEFDAEAKVPNRSIKASVQGMSMTMNLWNVKYLGFEDVEVPAGKYEKCLKLTYVLKQTSPQGSDKTTVEAWYAKGVGPVKKISADSKGNPVAEEVLAEIK